MPKYCPGRLVVPSRVFWFLRMCVSRALGLVEFRAPDSD